MKYLKVFKNTSNTIHESIFSKHAIATNSSSSSKLFRDIRYDVLLNKKSEDFIKSSNKTFRVRNILNYINYYGIEFLITNKNIDNNPLTNEDLISFFKLNINYYNSLKVYIIKNIIDVENSKKYDFNVNIRFNDITNLVDVVINILIIIKNNNFNVNYDEIMSYLNEIKLTE